MGIRKDLPPREELEPYQVVGGVTAHQAFDGIRTERLAGHTGTETLARLLREAAVENLPQWAQA